MKGPSRWSGCHLTLAVLLLPAAAGAQPRAGSEPLPGVRSGWIEVPADHLVRRAQPRKLYFERLGEPGKKPAIVLHGGPGHAPPMLQVLQRSEPGRMILKHYDLLYLHQRGSGRSLLPEEAQLDAVIRQKERYRIEQYVEDLELVRKKVFGERRVTLIGGSWGGFLGLAYAIKYQPRLDALILGSFEATASTGVEFCPHFDRSMFAASADHPELRAALAAFQQALAKRKIVWHRGKKEQRTLSASELIEVALPFAYKARFAGLAAMLQKLARGEREGQTFLDGLGLDETASAGGSLPGTATYCQTLMSKAQLEAAIAAPPPAFFADCGKVNRSLRRVCAPFFPAAQIDLEQALPRLTVPALLFAGRWDPAIAWQATARTAAKMKNATFLLIKGGHMPIDEGGGCLARIIEALATRRFKYDLSCL